MAEPTLKDRLAASAQTAVSAAGGVFNTDMQSSVRQQYASAFVTPSHPLSDALQRKADLSLKGAGKALWRGMAQVAASGFGKGLLITAGLFILASGLGQGFAFYAGSKLFADGLAVGAGAAVQFLFSSLGGLTALAIGGTLGAVADVKLTQNRITAELAQAEANNYEILRLQQQLAASPPQQQNTTFQDRLAAERTQAAEQQRTL